MEKGCQNCDNQHAPDNVEPCKPCVEDWVKHGKHSTKWSNRRLGTEEETQ